MSLPACLADDCACLCGHDTMLCPCRRQWLHEYPLLVFPCLPGVGCEETCIVTTCLDPCDEAEDDAALEAADGAGVAVGVDVAFCVFCTRAAPTTPTPKTPPRQSTICWSVRFARFKEAIAHINSESARVGIVTCTDRSVSEAKMTKAFCGRW